MERDLGRDHEADVDVALDGHGFGGVEADIFHGTSFDARRGADGRAGEPADNSADRAEDQAASDGTRCPTRATADHCVGICFHIRRLREGSGWDGQQGDSCNAHKELSHFSLLIKRDA
jgi:hypothetical protein